MDDVRIGIAGLGHRALNWIRLLQEIPGYRITAIYDWIEPLQARALGHIRAGDDVAVFSDYEDFLAFDGMDAVGLCVRRKEVGEMAARALEAGKHVNSEVPAAYTMGDCWRIVTDVERTGMVYSLAEQTRYWGVVEGWRQLVTEGRLGRITYAEGQYVGWYGTNQYFQDFKTGKQVPIESLPDHPEAEPTVLHTLPTIIGGIGSHDMSVVLKVLDDRVVEVVGMSTNEPSYSFPEISRPDIQVALMKTEKDTVIRMLCGFTQSRPHCDHHWWQFIGTKGGVEWRRSLDEKPKMWLADTQMNDWAEVDWQYQRTDAPSGARGSGHGDADYYVHAHFRDAVREGKPLPLDVYRAMDTVAPAIMAHDSIEAGSTPLKVPDFRPSPDRRVGEMPGGRGVGWRLT